MIIELNFEKISKTVKNSTAKSQNFSLSIYQKRLDILPLYIKERLTLYKVINVSSFCHNPTPSSVIGTLSKTTRSRRRGGQATEIHSAYILSK